MQDAVSLAASSPPSFQGFFRMFQNSGRHAVYRMTILALLRVQISRPALFPSWVGLSLGSSLLLSAECVRFCEEDRSWPCPVRGWEGDRDELERSSVCGCKTDGFKKMRRSQHHRSVFSKAGRCLLSGE